MQFEIDVLAVGEKSSGGDAMAIRYGNIHAGGDLQKVVVIDGGYSTDGQKLVDLIRDRYGTDHVDLVISTHPDQDHTSGLKVVVEQLNVDELWLHLPWAHSNEMKALRGLQFKSSALSDRVEASLQTASDLEALALSKGIPITEPFTGLSTADGVVRVVGPSVDYYSSLLAQILAGQKKSDGGLTAALSKLAEAAKTLVGETLHIETLSDDVETSPRNNSSTITLLDLGEYKCLFTGDAGIPALTGAADELAALGLGAGDLTVVQIPHHGSRRNVGPTILDRLLGSKGLAPGARGSAFVSAPRENPEHKHPAKKVTNAFNRRGYSVLRTQGENLCIPLDGPPRPGYGPATLIPFFDQVEHSD